MMCYRDRSYCADHATCTQAKNCGYVLTESEGKRAESMGLPIAWASFKEICDRYEEKKQ